MHMQKIIQQPDNKNQLYPHKWIFTITSAPNLMYFCQSIRFPGVSADPVKVENRFGPVFVTPDKMAFEQLTLKFIIDEDMRTWEETFKWIKGETFPYEHKEYSDQKKKGLYSDAILELNTNNNTPNFRIKFINCFPVSLSGFDLDFEEGPETPITSDVTFQYDRFEFDRT